MLDPLFAKLRKNTPRLKIGVTSRSDQIYSVAAEILSGVEFLSVPVFLVFPDMKSLKGFSEAMDDSLSRKGYEFPPIDILPFEPMRASFSTMKTRMNALLSLAQPIENGPKMYFTTYLSLLQRTIAPHRLESYHQTLRIGDRIRFSELARWLENSGFERVFQVQNPGEYSIRGFIFDVYPLNQVEPYRIETFDEEIEEIRVFSHSTQKTIGNKDQLDLYPASESIHSKETLSIFADRIQGLSQKYPNSLLIQALEKQPFDYPALAPLFHDDFQALIRNLPAESLFLFFSFEEGIHQIQEYERGLFDLYPHMEYRDIYYRYVRIPESALLQVNRAVFLSHSIQSIEIDQQIHAEGFAYKAAKKKPSLFLQFPSQPIPSHEDLSIGNLVVHEDFGVARYLGNQRISNFLGTREYLKLEYEDQAIIFVPVEKMHRIHLYVGDERIVQLTRLKSQHWQRAKRQTLEEIERKVQELIELYAVRSEIPGCSFTPEPELEKRFLDSFPYIETPPQLRAVERVLSDMEHPHPMDHLICGDAGAGKTEIALRASFRAIANGKQVALLVPTTVLTQQHFDTFQRRLEPFGIQVRMLDRMVSPSEERKIHKGLKEGTVEMVIGTHKLFGRRIQFRDLGLLILDEEQKFGVDHKEKLQQIKKGVDVLTLTATPIPRTLYMGLSGIKSMSVIDTLPPGRVPIQTFVGYYDDRVVKTAILRELSRGGQVIYVHNRVEDMGEVFENVKRLVPEARMEMAHGQMKKSEFERVVSLFYSQETDILVCTTIIENGVDIPTANTLIVDDANRYGLSQLYQLRGRVGRSDRRAFAYFLYPRTSRLTPQAQSRLEAIFEHHGSGSGMKLAMKDMEIRGVGNVLGFEQHGNAQVVGLYLYQQMLDQVLIQKGLIKRVDANVSIKDRGQKSDQVEISGIPFDIVIPDSYVENSIERMRLYRRIAQSVNLKELEELKDEFRDRFGPLPEEARSLFEYATLRMISLHLGIRRIEVNEKDRRTKIVFFSIRETDRFSLRPFRGMIHRDEGFAILYDASKLVLLKLLMENYRRLHG